MEFTCTECLNGQLIAVTNLMVNLGDELAALGDAALPVLCESIADATIEYYRRLHRFEREFPKGQWITIRFDDLVKQPLATVEAVYTHLGLPFTGDAARLIGEEAAVSTRHRSRGHDYSLDQFGLTREAIHEPLREIFDAYGFEP